MLLCLPSFRGFTDTLWDQIEACIASTYLAFDLVWSTLFIIIHLNDSCIHRVATKEGGMGHLLMQD